MRPPSPVIRAAAWIGLLALSALAFPAGASLPPQPRFLEYRVAWNGIPAGGATVEITPGELAGHDSLVVEARARTNAFVDLFWAFRGTVRATLVADGDGLTPLHFVYERQMAGAPYLTWVDFDQHGGRGVYINPERRRELALDAAGIVDPITAVFRARLSGARPGDTLHYDVWTGQSRYRVQLQVGAPEPIEVPAGRFSALRVVPEVWKIDGPPKRETNLRQAAVWIADDPIRTLLRVRSELYFGAVTLDLARVDPPA